MAQQQPLTLKGYFVREATPTQIQFEDLIDSFLPMSPDDSESISTVSTIVEISREKINFLDTVKDADPDFTDPESVRSIVEYFVGLLTKEEDATAVIDTGVSARAIMSYPSDSTSKYQGRIWTGTGTSPDQIGICLTGWDGSIIYDLPSDTISVYT
ncbi:MAG: hypothetical protein AAGN35_23695 [Bacteroidota bacterium]